MKKVAIITDSVASLPGELKKRYGLKILPINIRFNGKTYQDGIDLSASEAYRMLQEDPDQFYASPASIGEYLKVFQETAKTAEGILCITLSSKLSSMYTTARLAKREMEEKSPPLFIELLDSRNAAVGEGLIVSAAAAAAAAGKSLPEVTQIARAVSDKIEFFAVLETIRYVYRTGRIPKLTARFGSLLNIRPIFIISEGAVKVIGITMDQEHGISRILKQMREQVQSKPVHVGVAHADALKAGERLKELICARFNCVEIWLTDFSPVMAYATGIGVLAVAYYTDN
jgi:DegV family protein with EDD domain